jgi:hypothetical protein
MASALLPLPSHPATPLPDDVRVAASTALDARGLVLGFALRAPLGAIVVPERAARPRRADRLWEHTCCEAFVGTPDGEPYVELNLSPSTDWALWAFDAYRAGMRAAPSDVPRVRVLRLGDELRVDAIVAADALAAVLGPPPYAVGLAVVVELSGGGRAYCALAHPEPRPDFHARAARRATVYPPLAT